MPDAGPLRTGFVAELWRYPVKSMRGEQIEASEVTDHGLLGDRVHALVDLDSGKIVSAKNPRTWPDMFDFRSELMRPPRLTDSLPPARITFPDGENARSDEVNIDERLSARWARRCISQRRCLMTLRSRATGPTTPGCPSPTTCSRSTWHQVRFSTAPPCI